MKKHWLLIVYIAVEINILNAQTKHIVEVSNFQFNPMNIDIAVGDTVEWQWVSGVHTTTSDSTSGQNVWDAPIDISNPEFSFVITSPGVHHYYCIPHQAMGMTGTITATGPNGVNDDKILPAEFLLSQNYPNPFNPSTEINFVVPQESFISIIVFDVIGNEITTLINEVKKSGSYEVEFVADKLPSGVYVYQLRAANFIQTRKMILLR